MLSTTFNHTTTLHSTTLLSTTLLSTTFNHIYYIHSITFNQTAVHYIQPYCILTQSTTLLSTTLLCNAFYHILPIQTHHFQPHQHHIQPHCSALLQVIPIVKSNSTNLQKCHIATKQQCIFCNDMAYFAGFAAICYPCWPSTAITARI